MPTYNEIEVPPGKDPTDYTYHERRAELLEFIIEAGHPDMLNRTKFADRYGCDKSRITRDIQTLEDEIDEELLSDAEFITSIVFRKGIRKKMDNGDIMEAAELAEKMNDWLQETGRQDTVADEMNVNLDAQIEKEERKALVGVDLTEFEGVDADQLVGVDAEDLSGERAELDADAAEIPLEENGHPEDGDD